MDIKKVATEVAALLPYLGKDYLEKLPQNAIDFIIHNADMSSIPEVDPNINIDKNPNISKDTRIFLTALKLKYWCENDEEKNNIFEILNNNEEKNNIDNNNYNNNSND